MPEGSEIRSTTGMDSDAGRSLLTAAFTPRCRICAWYYRRFAPRYQRLHSAIENTLSDIRSYKAVPKQGVWLDEAAYLTERARSAMDAGAFDEAWMLCANAQRKLVHGKGPCELKATATSLLKEIDDRSKFPDKHWRISAISDILSPLIKKPDNEITAPVLEECMAIRDERFENMYYRIAVMRQQVYILCLFLIFLVAAGLWFGPKSDADLSELLRNGSISAAPGVAALRVSYIAVAVFGAIGATVSALMEFGRVRQETKIPEHVTTDLLTFTRPFIGAASALIVTFAMFGNVIPLPNISPAAIPYFVWVVAFASGFTERLVIQTVSAASKAKP